MITPTAHTPQTHTPHARHTPGPWSNTPGQPTIWANDGETKVATIEDLPWITLSSGRRTSDTATEDANARLIAAAPDLLAALESAHLALVTCNSCHRIGTLPNESECMEIEAATLVARSALAKARSQ